MEQTHHQFDPNEMNIKISTFMFDFEEKKKFATYVIVVTYRKSKSWEVRRRQKQIEELEKDLKTVFPSTPDLPSTIVLFGDKYSTENLEKKIQVFDTYIRSLLYNIGHYTFEPFVRFLEIDKHIALADYIERPKLQGGYTVPGLVVSSMCVSLAEDMLVIACHDIYKLERNDKYFSNMLENVAKTKESPLYTKPQEKWITALQFLKRFDYKGSQQEQQSQQAQEELKPEEQETLPQQPAEEKQDADEIVEERNNGEIDEQDKPKPPQDPKLAGVSPVKGHPAETDNNSTPTITYSEKDKEQTKISKVEKEELSSEPKPTRLRHHLFLKTGPCFKELYFNYQPILSKGLRFRVTQMVWSRQLTTLILGFSTGGLVIVKHESSTSEKEIFFARAHQGEIIKCIVDEERKMVISIGADNKLATFDIEKESLISRLEFPGKHITDAVYDPISRLVFLSNKGQSIFVADLSRHDYDIKNKLATNLKPPLAGLDYYFTSNWIITASHSEKKIKILESRNFKNPKEPYSCVVELEGLAEATMIKYIPERKEVWTANKNGFLKIHCGVAPKSCNPTSCSLLLTKTRSDSIRTL